MNSRQSGACHTAPYDKGRPAATDTSNPPFLWTRSDQKGTDGCVRFKRVKERGLIVFRWDTFLFLSLSPRLNFLPSGTCADLHAQMSFSCSLFPPDIVPLRCEKTPDDGVARYFKRMCTLIQYALVHLSWNVWHAWTSLFASCTLRHDVYTWESERERISLSYSALQFILPGR